MKILRANQWSYLRSYGNNFAFTPRPVVVAAPVVLRVSIKEIVNVNRKA